MRLKKLLLRYYPPGIILEVSRTDESTGREEVLQKSVDLLTLTPDTNVDVTVNHLMRQETLIPEKRRETVRALVQKLVDKLGAPPRHEFALFKVLRAHILPLTNCAFNKSGDRFITGSYDRTCKIWDTNTGEELHTLEGHRNVVYAIAFNNPFGDKVVTGSFDKTCKLWNADTGQMVRVHPVAVPPTAATSIARASLFVCHMRPPLRRTILRASAHRRTAVLTPF